MKKMNWATIKLSGRKRGQRGEIVTKNENRCNFCKGTGLLSPQKGIKCPVCSGSGRVNVKHPAVICAYCMGTGKRHPRTTLTCTVCRGKGMVSVASSRIETCSACKGIGRERGKTLPCLRCKGTGVVPKKK